MCGVTRKGDQNERTQRKLRKGTTVLQERPVEYKAGSECRRKVDH